MKILKQICKAFIGIMGLILLLELVIYAWAPIYDFPEPVLFQGDSIYNPYRDVDSTSWKKANFHFHSRAWLGLTSGSKNSYKTFYDTYKMLGYDAPQISNYQMIDNHFKDSSFYIPTYEHGFGIRKKHHILIGTTKVLWFDYSIIQNRHHKQHILDLLRNDNDIVAIAHPDWEKGFSLNDMKYLTNYNLIEVLNNNWRSFLQWDEALSSGHLAYILANDDAHDIENVYGVGMCCTFINTPNSTTTEMISALKDGKAYGAEIDINFGDTYETKTKEAKKLPFVKLVEVKDDTLFVETTGIAFKFTFIGQNGSIRKITRYTNRAWYRIQPEDTYIRTSIRFFNYKNEPGTTLYLNPVFRTIDGTIPETRKPKVNSLKTNIFRTFSLAGILLVIVILLKRKNSYLCF